MTPLPDYAVAPGQHIQEWLDDQAINAAELARRLDVTPKHVSELLSGKAPLSATVALGLERVTGIPARIWNRFEAGYREDMARLAEADRLAAQYEQAKRFPLAYLRKWKYVSASARDKAGTVRDLLSVFAIADLDAFAATWVLPKVAYRKVTLATDKVYEALGEATAMLRGVGVAFCLIPPIPGFGVHGATRWISGHPVVQLSVRGKTDDQLWFTLFHELGHVLLHGQKTVFLQGAGDRAEAEADEFASSTLIPAPYQDLLPSGRNIAAVRDLAAELGIAPSIVLGQAQRATKDFAWGQKLRVRLVWDDTKAAQ